MLGVFCIFEKMEGSNILIVSILYLFGSFLFLLLTPFLTIATILSFGILKNHNKKSIIILILAGIFLTTTFIILYPPRYFNNLKYLIYYCSSLGLYLSLNIMVKYFKKKVAKKRTLFNKITKHFLVKT